MILGRRSWGQILRPAASAICLLLAFSGVAVGQNIPVTFRYTPQPGDNFVRLFLPGEFNNWGPNSSGVIAVGAPSAMSFDAATGDWLYMITLAPGRDYAYKGHAHYNSSGTDAAWFSDPVNPRTNPNDNNNSLVFVSDPMVFQLTRRLNSSGNIENVSAGVFGTRAITALTFEVNGVEADGMAHFDATSRIFRYDLPTPVPTGSQFKITATDDQGTTASDEIGLIPPVVEDAPLPPGARDGITSDDADATKATLSLFAPGKNYVHVIGDFNNWTPTNEYLMKRDSINADSIRFWLTLDGLTPGPEYAFQYLVDGELGESTSRGQRQ